jgi:hypothetical protein
MKLIIYFKKIINLDKNIFLFFIFFWGGGDYVKSRIQQVK